MSWLESALQPFAWIRELLSSWGDPWGIFVVAILVYGMALFFLAIIGHVVLIRIGTSIRRIAKALAAGSTIDELLSLEAGSARMQSFLNRLAYRMVTTSPGFDEPVRLPRREDVSAVRRMMQWALRRSWLMARAIGVLIAGLPGFFASAFGTVVLLAAVLTAFPVTVRSWFDAAGAFFAQTTWSEATSVTVATIAAAAIPIFLITMKLLVSDTAAAKRGFRRRHDEDALVQLYGAMPAVSTLASVLDEHLRDMVRLHSIERYNAEQWHRWAHRTAPGLHDGYWDRDDHIACDSGCLEPSLSGAGQHDPADDVKKAASDVEASWNAGLREQQSVIARLVSRRAWRGLVALRFCLSSEGAFFVYKLPSPLEWRRRRITWQHRQLDWRSPSEADAVAQRTVAVRASPWPGDGWMEHELRDRLWDLAELSRELSDLADFSRSLTRPRRLDKIAEISV